MNNEPRFWLGTIVVLQLIILLWLLSGCAAITPRGIVLEVDHSSHASAGRPFGDPSAEDSLTRASVMLHWRAGGLDVLAGEGINVRGRDGGGFYGPREVFSARASYEIPIGGRR